MKKVRIWMLIFVLLGGCISREAVILPEKREKLGFHTYTIRLLSVENSRALFVSDEVVSNMCFSVFRLTMEKHGYTLLTNGEIDVFLRFVCLENDLLQNKQRIFITMSFFFSNEPVAMFSFYAEDKRLLLDQRVLSREFSRGISRLKSSYQQYLREKRTK